MLEIGKIETTMLVLGRLWGASAWPNAQTRIKAGFLGGSVVKRRTCYKSLHSFDFLANSFFLLALLVA